ncbi:tetratricopeptide repeat protein [Amycolatopsis sp. lyj-23]|uniref:tetratricopeptide repeat protein n=1 Tax=Amycolatopsis sp. lyj-23 TaxID=2789283 RepID=UPI003977FAD9
MSIRDDETWHRLLAWTRGQAPSERLAAQVLLAEGFTDLDPSHPLGGPDGGRDAIARRDGRTWVMAVYFPRNQQRFADIKKKFVADFRGVRANGADGMVFVTNQEITLGQRTQLRESVDGETILYHLERIAAVLDQPHMEPVRSRILLIDGETPTEDPYVSVRRLFPDAPDIPDISGRERELAELSNFLRDGLHPSTVGAITGMAGAGKTALARRAAAEAAKNGWFPGGVLQVDFGEVQTPARHVLASVLYALDESAVRDDKRTLDMSYHDALHALARSGSRVLLILDNVTAPGEVLPLIPRDSAHRVLTTSRNIFAPRLDAAVDIRIGALSRRHSVELIRSKSRVNSIDVLDELAALCGDLPLALAIVAAIIRAEPDAPQSELVAELADETSRLSGLHFADLEVKAALQLSYSRLDDESARCFRLLSLNPGKEFGVGVMASMLDEKDARTRQLIRSLVHASLLEPGSTTGRWKMHDLVRLYSAECLSAEVNVREVLTIRARLVDYYFDLAVGASRWLDDTPGMVDSPTAASFRDHAEALNWFQSEIDNLVPCVYQALEIGHYAEAWDLGMAAGKYLFLRGAYRAALPVFDEALTAARKRGDAENEAGALNSVGLTQTALGDYDGAIKAFKAGLRCCREAGDQRTEAQLLVGFASALRDRGDPDASLGPLRRAVKLGARVKDARGYGFHLTNLGISLREAGELDEAARVLRRALTVHRATGSRRAEASTMAQLGTALYQANGAPEAEELLLGAIDIAAEVGDLSNRASMMINLGNIYIKQDKSAAAIRCYEEALAVFQEHGNRLLEVTALTNLAKAYARLGRSDLVARADRRRRELTGRQ